MELATKTYESPALLSPADLAPIRAIAGEAALDYVTVIGGFHFINRIADLLHVDLEGLPAPMRRFEPLRRLGVRLASKIMSRFDLDNRSYGPSYEQALESITPVLQRAHGRPPGEALAPLRSRPKLIEILKMILEERDERSSLDRETIARVHRGVEQALPSSIDEAEGLHPRPDDPIDDLVFVGTRYAYRTTEAMIERLRESGYDDRGILDLAIAISDANNWARLHRLLGLAPELVYLTNSSS